MKRIKENSLLIVFLILSLAKVDIILAQESREVISWLEEYAYNLHTTNPNLPINSVKLDTVFKNLSLVLAGEANHGTKEFVQVKHRLFRYLVKSFGFKYFLAEVDFAAALRVDNYICNGIGNPIEVLRNLDYFHIVNNEGLTLIKWMREYNREKERKDQIRFFGIDCQKSVTALLELKAYFLKVDSSFHSQIAELSLIYESPGHPVTTLDEKYGPHVLPKDKIELLRLQLNKKKTQYENASSMVEYTIAKKLAGLLTQANEVHHSNQAAGVREKFMAENVDWILNEFDEGDKKAFLWAHNIHVSYGQGVNIKTNWSWGTLGQQLKDKYGNKVYSIAIFFNQGSFVVSEVIRGNIEKTTITLDPAPADIFSTLLGQIGPEVLFIDFRGIRDPQKVFWLKNNPLKFRECGAVFWPDHQYKNYFLAKNFDGMIFIDTIQAVTIDLE